jgi:DNA-directed RNA polymerase subunit N (RpoN/RPB10)
MADEAYIAQTNPSRSLLFPLPKPERFRWRLVVLRVETVFCMKKTTQPHTGSTHQTVMEISTRKGSQSIRIGFTDQRLSAYGGMALWSGFLHKRGVRQQLQRVLPFEPSSPNAYDPTDVALGFLGGVLSGADKLSRVAYLRHDPAIAEVLGVEAVPSQSTLSRFMALFDQPASEQLNGLHLWAAGRLPSLPGGYTLDLDSWSLLHEDGHQEGVMRGYTPKGLEPCHRPLIACLAEPKLVAGFWLRKGNAQCPEGVPEFVGGLLDQLPKHIRIGCVRADAGFYNEKVLQLLEQRRLHYIIVLKLYKKWQKYCRHSDEAWTPTDVPGVEAQEIPGDVLGRRIIILRHRLSERPEACGKALLEVPGYLFHAMVTNLPASWSVLSVWRRYNGRAESENRIKELGSDFGVKGFCCRKFWSTQAVCQLAIWAYNLCVLLQRELGLLEKLQLKTLRWRLFCRAGVWSLAQGRPTLKLAIRGDQERSWWVQVIEKLKSMLPPLNCIAVEFSAA